MRRRRLLKLAEAHRRVKKSGVEYDETLRDLVRKLRERPSGRSPTAAEPTLTRAGEARKKGAETSTR